jgi:hypothetical protein
LRRCRFGRGLNRGIVAAEIGKQVLDIVEDLSRRLGRHNRDVRTCTDCSETKPLAGFLPIRGQRAGVVYGVCRTCRNELARERYRADSEERERQKARARRNAANRRAAALSIS